MKHILSLAVTVAAIQLVSTSVIRDGESTLEQSAAPLSLQAPPVAPKTPKVPEHETKVVAHAVEHTAEYTEEHDEEHDDKVSDSNPNDSLPESYIVSPQDKLYAEFADSPDANPKPTSQGSSDADETEKVPELGAFI